MKKQTFYWRIVTVANYRLNIKIHTDDIFRNTASYSINYWHNNERIEVKQGCINLDQVDSLISDFIAEHGQEASEYTSAVRKGTVQFLCKIAFDSALAAVRVSERIQGETTILKEAKIEKNEIVDKLNKFSLLTF